MKQTGLRQQFPRKQPSPTFGQRIQTISDGFPPYATSEKGTTAALTSRETGSIVGQTLVLLSLQGILKKQ